MSHTTSPGTSTAVLDNLAWHALTSTHARFAEGSGPVRRYDPEVAGFVAIEHAGREAWTALVDLVGPGETVLLSGDNAEAAPQHWERAGGGFGHQLVLGSPIPPRTAPDAPIRTLATADVPAMLALVALTQPGPFRVRTIELGEYSGVFEGEQLIAMAGERLQTPGFTEISAVCTHPDVRGRGLAAALTTHVARGVLARGQTPMLHVAEHNVNAQRVYERLGFVVRRRLAFTALVTPS